MQQYVLSEKPLGSGTFGVVWQATHIQSKQTFAMKILKKPYGTMEEVQELAEVQAMRHVGTHPYILKLHEVVYDRSHQTAGLVLDLMQSNLYETTCSHRKQRKFMPDELVSHYLYALLKGLAHLHKCHVFHRDLKPENIMVDGLGGLKVADMGSVKGIFKPGPHTEYTGTRWYRSPEVLLTSGHYGAKMDIWAVGCVFFEMMALDPLFPGKTELGTLELIHCILGSPSDESLEAISGFTQGQFSKMTFPKQAGRSFKDMLRHFGPSDDAIDLLEKLLCYEPKKRITASKALRHPYFSENRRTEKLLLSEAKSALSHSTSSNSSGSSQPFSNSESSNRTAEGFQNSSFEPTTSTSSQLSQREDSQRKEEKRKKRKEKKEEKSGQQAKQSLMLKSTQEAELKKLEKVQEGVAPLSPRKRSSTTGSTESRRHTDPTASRKVVGPRTSESRDVFYPGGQKSKEEAESTLSSGLLPLIALKGKSHHHHVVVVPHSNTREINLASSTPSIELPLLVYPSKKKVDKKKGGDCDFSIIASSSMPGRSKVPRLPDLVGRKKESATFIITGSTNSIVEGTQQQQLLSFKQRKGSKVPLAVKHPTPMTNTNRSPTSQGLGLAGKSASSLSLLASGSKIFSSTKPTLGNGKKEKENAIIVVVNKVKRY